VSQCKLCGADMIEDGCTVGHDDERRGKMSVEYHYHCSNAPARCADCGEWLHVEDVRQDEEGNEYCADCAPKGAK
jgi:hypothetical protein